MSSTYDQAAAELTGASEALAITRKAREASKALADAQRARDKAEEDGVGEATLAILEAAVYTAWAVNERADEALAEWHKYASEQEEALWRA